MATSLTSTCEDAKPVIVGRDMTVERHPTNAQTSCLLIYERQIRISVFLTSIASLQLPGAAQFVRTMRLQSQPVAAKH